MKIPSLALLAAAPLLALAPAAAAQDPAAQALDEAMRKMMHGMHMQSGDPNRDFAAMMIVHHQGAIDMANAELAYGDDPEMRALAAEIIAAQEQEIAEMKAWLEAQD